MDCTQLSGSALLRLCILALLAGLSPALVSATPALGVNYYHESLVSQQWGIPYIPRTIAGVGQDFDHIKSISTNIKFYMNPFVDANLPWIQQLIPLAHARGMHTVVNMMVDDRQITDANWNDYADRVANACAALSGKADELLVGNEITLHSPLSRTDIKNRVVTLINRCKTVFPGPVSYEEFWYAKDVWQGYTGKIYFMMYENLASFQTNINEMDAKFGANVLIGEWGEDLLDGTVVKDEAWQRDQIIQRWNIIAATRTPVAYIFTYREPNWNAFGIIRPDGTDRLVWPFLASLGSGSTPPPPPPAPSPTPSPTLPPAMTGIGSLALSCTANSACTLKTDAPAGACRTVTWSTSSGDLKVLGCEKGGGYDELYLQTAPAGIPFSACFANGCVTKNNGFARFIPAGAPSTPSPTLPPAMTGIGSLPFQSQPAGMKVSDVLSGGCRNVQYSTSAGSVSVKACDKGGGWYEMYLLSPPNSVSVCVNAVCVGPATGFARFTV